MRVGFVIAGVQKGGTTSIYEYLRQHPRIGMSQVKETHFFDNEAEFQGPRGDYEHYHSFFEERPQVDIYGEATPIYTYWPEAIPRLYRYNPQMKVIVLLRNPVQRAWSGWRMEKNRGTDSLSFSEAIRVEAERSKESYPNPHRVYSYVDRGLYTAQIRRVQQFFPNSALFLKSEHLFTRTSSVVSELLRFLGVPPYALDTSLVHFQGVPEQGPTREDRLYLLEQFRDDIAATEALLGWDCRDWLRV